MSRVKIRVTHRVKGPNGTLKIRMEGEHELEGSPDEVRSIRRALLRRYREDIEWSLTPGVLPPEEDVGEDLGGKRVGPPPSPIRRTLEGAEASPSSAEDDASGEVDRRRSGEESGQTDNPYAIDREVSRERLLALSARLKEKRERGENT